MEEGARQVAYRSIIVDVEGDFVPSIGFHSEHLVITDHEHQPELGCSGLDHHH